MFARFATVTRTAAALALAAAVVAAPTHAQAGTSYEATAANKDSLGRYTGGHAFHSPQGTAVFADHSGMFETFDNGTAHLTGTIVDKKNPGNQFIADVHFTNAMTYEQYTNPAGHLDPNGIVRHGMPKLELKNSSYVWNGGPIDPKSFTFYYLNESNSTLTGIMDLAGVNLDLTQRPSGADYGKMIFMFGEGANGKNGNLGLSGWLAYNIDGQFVEHGDINIDLTPKAVPTPSAALLGLAGLATLGLRRRRNA